MAGRLTRCSGVLLLSLLALVSGCSKKKQARVTVPDAPQIARNDADNCRGCDGADASSRPAPSLPPASLPPVGKSIYSEVGLASWYGPPYHNRRGANGEIYDMNALTAAHKTLPLNSTVRVTNPATGHSVVVRITDRGPFIGERMIDLSLAAARAVDVWRPGVAKVKIDVLEAPAAISTGGRWAVQIGAFREPGMAVELKSSLQRRYRTANVIEFTGPTGDWVRIRPLNDDRARAQEIARETQTSEGGVFLVRLD